MEKGKMFKKFFVATIAMMCLVIFSNNVSFAKSESDTDIVEVGQGLYYTEDGATWNPDTGTMTFVKTGDIEDPNLKEQYSDTWHDLKLDAKYKVWKVPTTVKKIVIKKGATVNGRFEVLGTCTIEGEDRNTSEIYGTSETTYSHNRENFNGVNYNKPWEYNAIKLNNAGTLTVKNLTIRNPYGYCITTYNSKGVFDIDGVNMIDDRGGDQNNSDGISAGPGSTIKNCYFHMADDSIKLYHSQTVENCTIDMLHNGAPFQIGWGSGENDDTVATLKNITINEVSDVAAHYVGVFSWCSPSNTKTVDITVEDITVNTPNAELFHFVPAAPLNITMTGAQINSLAYGLNNTTGLITINGTTEKASTYNLDGTTETKPIPVNTEDNSKAPYGTPKIDGEIDDIWSGSPVLNLNQLRLGGTDTTGTCRLLWDNDNLYMLTEVKDSNLLNSENAMPYEQDCCEIFVDPDNSKSTSLDENDARIFLNYANEITDWSVTAFSGVESSTKVLEGQGYIVEIKIPLGKTVNENDKIGFDCQLNVTNGSYRRFGVVGWAGDKNTADATARTWGNITLVKEITDKDDLNQIIVEAEKRKATDYTADSWKKFQTALSAAKSVANAEDVTQNDIDSAIKNLKMAIEALVEKPLDSTESEKPVSDKTDDSMDTSVPMQQAENPQTGDDATVLPYVLLAFAAIIVFGKCLKRAV